MMPSITKFRKLSTLGGITRASFIVSVLDKKWCRCQYAPCNSEDQPAQGRTDEEEDPVVSHAGPENIRKGKYKKEQDMLPVKATKGR